MDFHRSISNVMFAPVLFAGVADVNGNADESRVVLISEQLLPAPHNEARWAVQFSAMKERS
jgi:hypothetical protein